MRTLPFSLLAFVVGIATAGVTTSWVVLASPNGAPAAPIPACGPNPAFTGAGTQVPGGQFVWTGEVITNDSNHYGGPVPQSRISTWSHSSSTYYLYVMSQSDLNALGWTSNASGPSHSTVPGPAQHYLWSSGPVTSTNHTVLVGNGQWYTVLYNPGTSVATVYLEVANCNPP